MILSETTNGIQTSGNIVPTTFTIRASRKAFEILSSGLYSHKIQAIVRELGTNAADAHIAAGHDKPFQVTLPTTLYAFFEVKDFGTGLSEADVLTLYTTYFESNKTNSNQYTGCLGLGSKSPFSYTDSFTVESRYEGVKTSYTAYLDAQSFPSISVLGRKDTDEPNGLTVRIPVERDNFDEFATECEHVYQWFQVRPTILGDFDGFGYYVTLFDGDNYTVGRKLGDTNNSYRSFESAKLVMGNVSYPLDANKIDTLRNWKDYGLVLYADIGDVNIAASREALSYDEKTLAYLSRRGQELKDQLPGHCSAHVADAQTLWEARTRLYRLRGLLRDLKVSAQWRGRELDPEVKIETVTGNDPEVTINEYSWGQGRWSHKTLQRSTKQSLRQTWTVRPDRDIWLVDSKHWRAALMTSVPQDKTVYVITDLKEGSTFLADTGIGEVIKRTSSVPLEQIEKIAKVKKPKAARVTVYEFAPNQDGDSGNISSCVYWKKVATTPISGVYIIIDRFVPTGGIVNQTIKYMINALASVDKKTKVYGIRKSDVPILGKRWTELKDHVKAVVKKVGPPINKAEADRAFYHAHKNKVLGIFLDKKVTPTLKGLSRNHSFRVLVQNVLAASKLGTKIAVLNTLLRYVDSSCPMTVSTMTTEYTAIKKLYPLLDSLDNDVEARDVLTYIKLMDKR